MSVLLLAVSAVVPSLLLMWFFHSRDVFPEPPRVLWTTFALGIAAVVPVLAMALPLDAAAEQLDHPLAFGLASAFLGAAIPEELCKLLVLWFYAARHSAFDEPMDGVVYGVAASLGFATLENVLYVTGGGLGVAALRAVLAVPGHAFLGAIMGYYVGRATVAGAARRGPLAAAFVIPTLLHGFYDFPLLATARVTAAAAEPGAVALLLPLAPILVVVEWRWALRLVRRLRAGQLAARSERLCLPPVPVPPASGSGRGLGWLLVLGGGLGAAVGGMVCLAVGLALLFVLAGVEGPSDDSVALLVGGLVLGAAPLASGLTAFAFGLVRLNRAAPTA